MDYLHVQADNPSYNYYLSHGRSRRLRQSVFAAARAQKEETLVKACTCIREAIRGYSSSLVMGQYIWSKLSVDGPFRFVKKYRLIKVFRTYECADSS